MATERYSKSHKNEFYELQKKCIKLEQQLENKNTQIEDLSFELRKLSKKQSIWQDLNKKQNESDLQKQNKRLQQDNSKLMREISILSAQREQEVKNIEQLKEKIVDLKYHNQQLKKLNERSQSIHRKQIQIFKGLSKNDKQVQLLKLQKEKLERKIVKCGQIAKQMEQFYMCEIKKLQNNQQQQKSVIIRLESQLETKINELHNASHRCESLSKKIEENQWKETDIQKLICQQNSQKRWELALHQVKERYQRQINELKDNMRFLILKLESSQENNSFVDTFTPSLLAKSKLIMSTSSACDSFRFTPNNSFSSSIKQSLSKRESAPLRTPNKNSRQKSINYLLDKTNL